VERERLERRVVLVSGAPGAGKSTLAVPLAAELGFAPLRKDRIKETLHDALGPAAGSAPTVDLTWSRREVAPEQAREHCRGPV
jgi:2-phosphoglycerate kinase